MSQQVTNMNHQRKKIVFTSQFHIRFKKSSEQGIPLQENHVGKRLRKGDQMSSLPNSLELYATPSISPPACLAPLQLLVSPLGIFLPYPSIGVVLYSNMIWTQTTSCLFLAHMSSHMSIIKPSTLCNSYHQYYVVVLFSLL